MSEFKILDAVEKLPTKTTRKAEVYDKLIKALDKKPKGIYPVTIENRKTTTVYLMLAKRLKDRKDQYTVHYIQQQVFIEKL